MDLEERKVGPMEEEEAKEQLDLDLDGDGDENEREDVIDELDEDEIDRLMETAHDSPGWQPGECARVEQSHRFTILGNQK